MGLLDDFSQFVKTPEGMGLLSAVAGGLAGANRGTPINNLGRAGLAGVMGYGNALDRQERTLENEQQRKLRQMQMDEYLKKAQEAEKERAFFSDPSRFISSPAQQALANGQGPTNENAAAMPSFSPQLDVKSLYGEMLKSGSPSLGMKAIEGLAKQEQPKLKEIKNFSIGGKVSPVMIFENGKAKTMDGYDVPPEIVLQNLGNRVQAIDKNTLKGGENLSIGISPDTVYSGGITMRGQNMTDARARESNAKPQFSEGQWVYPPSQNNPQGVAISPPGFNKPPTESQSKDNLFATRANKSHQILTDLEGKYSRAAVASKESVSNAPLVGGVLGVAANSMLGEDAQKAEQAQRDFINAVLRKESGAVISPEEFNNARKQYFPQPGDSDAVVEQKRQNRITSIEGIASGAGSAGKNIDVYKDGAKSKSVKLDDGTSVIATRGKDGNYYVKRNGKNYRVEE